MKQFAALVSLLGVALLWACKNRPVLATATSGKSLLWEISGNGLQKPSYFLGTMHLMCAEDAVLSNSTKAIIKQVGKVYLEVDMDNAGELLSGVLAMTNIEGKSLQQVLPAEDYDRVKNFFEQHQPSLPFSMLEKQHPLLLTSSLYELFLTCEKTNGIELLLVDEAYKLKKETGGLETMAFQANIFNQIPYDQQAFELVKTIDSIGKYKQSLDEMVKLYKQQDIDRLHELTSREDSETGAYSELLIDSRNRNWVAQFDPIAKRSASLFAVGAGHLGGENGVINLLKKKGYTVRPLQNDPATSLR
jgi:uncharacterized protein